MGIKIIGCISIVCLWAYRFLLSMPRHVMLMERQNSTANRTDKQWCGQSLPQTPLIGRLLIQSGEEVWKSTISKYGDCQYLHTEHYLEIAYEQYEAADHYIFMSFVVVYIHGAIFTKPVTNCCQRPKSLHHHPFNLAGLLLRQQM